LRFDFHFQSKDALFDLHLQSTAQNLKGLKLHLYGPDVVGEFNRLKSHIERMGIRNLDLQSADMIGVFGLKPSVHRTLRSREAH
jgi:hypothetical protein